jgi:hypothetical protein
MPNLGEFTFSTRAVLSPTPPLFQVISFAFVLATIHNSSTPFFENEGSIPFCLDVLG